MAVISIPYTPVNILAPARPTPLIITLPGPIPYSSENDVPWHYETDVYYHGAKQDEKLSEDKPSEDISLNVDNLAGTGRITRSGRVYSP